MPRERMIGTGKVTYYKSEVKKFPKFPKETIIAALLDTAI